MHQKVGFHINAKIRHFTPTVLAMTLLHAQSGMQRLDSFCLRATRTSLQTLACHAARSYRSRSYPGVLQLGFLVRFPKASPVSLQRPRRLESRTKIKKNEECAALPVCPKPHVLDRRNT